MEAPAGVDGSIPSKEEADEGTCGGGGVEGGGERQVGEPEGGGRPLWYCPPLLYCAHGIDPDHVVLPPPLPEGGPAGASAAPKPISRTRVAWRRAAYARHRAQTPPPICIEGGGGGVRGGVKARGGGGCMAVVVEGKVQIQGEGEGLGQHFRSTRAEQCVPTPCYPPRLKRGL